MSSTSSSSLQDEWTSESLHLSTSSFSSIPELPTTLTQRMPYLNQFEWYCNLEITSDQPSQLHQSPIFISAGQAWTMSLRRNHDNNNAISIFLSLHSPLSSTQGSLALLPEFVLTFIHPSGDATRNMLLMHHNRGGTKNMIQATSTSSFATSSSSSYYPSSLALLNFTTLSSLSTAGFLDHDNGLLVRCELFEVRKYEWITCGGMREILPALGQQPPLQQQHQQRYSSSASRIPTPSHRVTRSSTQSLTHGTNGSGVGSSTNAIGTPRHQPQHHQQHPPTPHSSSMPHLSSMSSVSGVMHVSTSSSSSPSTHSSSTPSSLSPVPELLSFQSSPIMYAGYEFFLKLKQTRSSSRSSPISTHSSAAGANDFSLSLVLHPRHHYRFKEEISIKLEVEFVLSAHSRNGNSNNAASSSAMIDHSSTPSHALHYRIHDLVDTGTPQLEWKHAGAHLMEWLKSNYGRGSNNIDYSQLNLHISLSVTSFSLVWSIPSFPSLSSSRRISSLFRMNNLTWNLIVDPKGNGEPGWISVYLALDKTAQGAFCHGLTLMPVFTLGILHPQDPSQHLIRRFEDATFTFEKSSWGCTCFIELATLYSGGWIRQETGILEVEVQIQSTKIVRPYELSVETKVGPEVKERRVTGQLREWGDWMQHPNSSNNQDDAPMTQQQVVTNVKMIQITPSSPAHQQGGYHQQHRPFSSSSSPLLVVQSPSPYIPPISSHPHPHPLKRSTSYSSRQSGSSSPNSQYSNASSNSSSSSSHSSLPRASSSSPPLTPMYEYLGSDYDDHDSDAYALTVQARRFGGKYGQMHQMQQQQSQQQVNQTYPSSSSSAVSMSDTSWVPPLRNINGRSNSSFLYGKQQSVSNDRPGSPPPLLLPPSLNMLSSRNVLQESIFSSPPPLMHTASSSSSASTTAQPLQQQHQPQHPLTSTTRHGYVVVIRNSQFTDPKLPQLIGYEVDEDRLMNTFLHALHCDMETHLNIVGTEMHRVFSTLSKKDYSCYDYLMVFILSHGVDSNTIYAADGAHLGINEIFAQFRGMDCPTLAGKPKLFFVQACRGNAVDYSVREGSGIPNLTDLKPIQCLADGTLTHNSATSSNGNTSTTQQPQQHQTQQLSTHQAPPTSTSPPPPPPPHQPLLATRSPSSHSLPLGHSDIPNESDFLYASSCVPSYISWTNTASGSWFITALCNVLLSYWPKMHLGDILLRVNYALSKQNKLVEKYGCVYQIAAPAFTLRKKLFFSRQTNVRTTARLPTALDSDEMDQQQQQQETTTQ